MKLIENTYLCFAGFGQQTFHSNYKSVSSFSHSGSSGMVFLCLKSKTPAFKPGRIIKRSVSKIFDCVGLTKPQLISKLQHFCYLRFYAAILGNVAELTTLKKQSHKGLFTASEMAINLQNEHCQSASFLLSLSREKIKKMKQIFAFLGFPLYKREF